MSPEESVPKTEACVEDCKEGTHGYVCPHDGDPIQEQPVTETKLDSADLGSAKPLPAKVPTSKEIGEYRARYFTVRNSTVVACQHKLDVHRFPTSNCEDCWEAFFELNPEGLSATHEVLLNQGIKPLEAMHGKKFVKKLGNHLKRMLLKLASPEVKAASGIDENKLQVFDIQEERRNNA